MKLFLLLIFLTSIKTTYSQMAEGQYRFKNELLTLELNIAENGWTVLSAALKNDSTLKISSGNGVFRQANGLQWYEFQTPKCNYSFSITNDTLFLEQFDCSNGQPSTTYILTKKVIDWTGTYKNEMGVLVINNINKESSFNFHLTYDAGKTSCGKLDWSDTAILTSNNSATSGTAELELNGSEIVFSPNIFWVGMECQKFFLSVFIKE